MEVRAGPNALPVTRRVGTRQDAMELPVGILIRFMTGDASTDDPPSSGSTGQRDRPKTAGVDRFADRGENVRWHLGVHGDAHDRVARLGLAADVHRGDVDVVVPEDRPDLPDDPG